jgi:hypothetical protein
LIRISTTLSDMSDDLPPHPNVVIELNLFYTCLMGQMLIMLITYINFCLIILACLE